MPTLLRPAPPIDCAAEIRMAYRLAELHQLGADPEPLLHQASRGETSAAERARFRHLSRQIREAPRGEAADPRAQQISTTLNAVPLSCR